MKTADLFSGIGGFALGLERAGAETIAFCEIDDYASRVLEKQWPTVPNIRGGVWALNALLKSALTRSQRASLARTYPSLAKAPDLPEPVRDSCGLYYEPFAWFDQPARCWRTWQRCLVEGWEIFSDTWPRSGMTRNGIAFRRQPLVRLTGATVSGSFLPTPEASNTKAVALRSAGRSPRDFLAPLPTPRPCSGKRSSGANRTEIMRALETWPTPEAHARGATPKHYKRGNPNLAAAVKFPTPRATDADRGGRGDLLQMVRGNSNSHFATPSVSGNYNRKGASAKSGDGLATQVGGALNPTWVEWLMGFPLGWTDLGALATRLSRKSSKRSAAP